MKIPVRPVIFLQRRFFRIRLLKKTKPYQGGGHTDPESLFRIFAIEFPGSRLCNYFAHDDFGSALTNSSAGASEKYLNIAGHNHPCELVSALKYQFPSISSRTQVSLR